ncbi:MAG: hypothetical protein KGL53_11795, partial [Elusimicrobia bacterium]|nr:hypothetical protein [Elusimicrobiota bacterium]
TAQVLSSEFYQDPRDPAAKAALWTLGFSHPVDPKSLERLLSLTRSRGDRPLPRGEKAPAGLTVSYDEFMGKAYVRSEKLPVPDDDETVALLLRPGLRSSRGGEPSAGGLVSPVTVPGMYTYFRGERADAALPRGDDGDPRQVLALSFTAEALEKDAAARTRAWLLPPDLPPAPGRKGVAGYFWHDPADVGPFVLAAARPVPLTPLPAAADHARLQSFGFQAPPGRFLYVRVSKGTRAFGGYVLSRDYDAVVRVPAYPRELRIMGQGSILSPGGAKRVAVLARGLRAVRFEVGRVLPGELDHLVSQSGGRMSDPSFTGGFGPDDVVERFTRVERLAAGEPGRAQYASLDLSPYMSAPGGGRRGLFLVAARAWDPDRDRPDGPSARRLILVTDLGLVAKEGAGGGRDVFVMSLSAGGPAAGAEVSVLGRNGLPLAAARADAQGRVSFPSFEGDVRERQPTAFTARLGEDLS